MNPIDLHIRRAGPADVATLADFNAAMALETEGKRLETDRLRRGVAAVLADESLGRYYLADGAGRAVGALMLTSEWSDWRNGLFWWIQSVFVLPESRGRGVYRALYEEVLRTARADPAVCGLRLYVDRENQRAQEVYRKLGMTESGYRLFEVDFTQESS